MRLSGGILALFVCLVGGQQLPEPSAVAPFKIIGNIYYVGTSFERVFRRSDSNYRTSESSSRATRTSITLVDTRQ
jgi:hypothetical protein